MKKTLSEAIKLSLATGRQVWIESRPKRRGAKLKLHKAHKQGCRLRALVIGQEVFWQ